MRKLFISHYTEYDHEVTALAQELHLLGVPVWLDHEAGFTAGGNLPDEARKAILDKHETFGLILYATPEVFKRDFIGRVEIQSALRRMDTDPDFVLMALPRGMSFNRMAELSTKHFGVDLSTFKSSQVTGVYPDTEEGLSLQTQFESVAEEILSKWLKIALRDLTADVPVGVNFCTREHIAPSHDDILDLNATWLLGSRVWDIDSSSRLLRALLTVRRNLRQVYAVPSLRVRGSKHLTTAFMLGWVFAPSTARAILVQQGSELWTTECTPGDIAPFECDIRSGTVSSSALYVEVTATDHDVRTAVRGFISKHGESPHVCLHLSPIGGPRRAAVRDNAVANSMALQIRAKILEVCHEYSVDTIHLFLAVPQGLAVLIGHHLRSTLSLYIYEYSDGQYHLGAVLGSSAPD